MIRKTITITNEEIYNKLKEMKGDKTWDEFFKSLIENKPKEEVNIMKKIKEIEERIKNLEKIFDALTRDEFVEQYEELKKILNLK